MSLTLTDILILATLLLGVIGVLYFAYLLPRARERAARLAGQTGLYLKPTDGPPPALTILAPGEFWLAIGISLAVFVAMIGPFWSGSYNAMRAIGWSYAVIPGVVAILLSRRGLLTRRAFLLDTLVVAAVKFCITALLLLCIWTLWGPDIPALPERATAGLHNEPTPPVPTVFEAAALRDIAGQVTGPDGAPVSEALVWVNAGLEGYAFAAPATPVNLVNDGTGLQPRIAIVEAWQPLLVRATDGRTHTMMAAHPDGKQFFNLPVVSKRSPVVHRLFNGAGLVPVRCVVHGDTEAVAHLLVLEHPHHTRTDAAGRFRLSGVPRGAVTLVAWHPDVPCDVSY